MTMIADKLSTPAIEGQRNRRLFWVQTGLAAVSGLLALITPKFLDWIEFLSGWDPDQHDGSVERLIIGGLFVVAAGMVAAAANEWRRDGHYAFIWMRGVSPIRRARDATR